MRRVRLPPVERQRLVARRQIGIARDAVVVGVPAERVGVEGEIARAGVEDDGAVEAVVDAGEGAAHLVLQARPGHGRGADRLHRHSVAARLRLRRAGQRIRYPVVGRVDDAADRLRAPAQRRRTAHHLDPFGGERIERHGVILAELRHAARADAVLLDAHAIGVEAAHDRAARGAGREARAGDAGLAEQEVAERRAAVALDLLAGDHGHGGELVGDDGEPARRRLGGGRRRCVRRLRGWLGDRACRRGGAWPGPHNRAWGVDHDLRQLRGRLAPAPAPAEPRPSDATTPRTIPRPHPSTMTPQYQIML